MSEHVVTVEVSARHLHLSPAHLQALFGPGYALTSLQVISQPGQFAAREEVEVQGPRGSLVCRVVGPTRSATQVELTTTECRRLGLPVVLRVSGALAGTPGARLVGPWGTVELHEGVVVAQRHLHASPQQAAALQLKHGDVVSIRTHGSRPVTFHEVFVRSREGIDALAFMLDTDEANAAGLRGGEQGEVLPKPRLVEPKG